VPASIQNQTAERPTPTAPTTRSEAPRLRTIADNAQLRPDLLACTSNETFPVSQLLGMLSKEP
jgi:hypothetical protein